MILQDFQYGIKTGLIAVVTIIYLTIGQIRSKTKDHNFELNNSLSNDSLSMEIYNALCSLLLQKSIIIFHYDPEVLSQKRM